MRNQAISAIFIMLSLQLISQNRFAFDYTAQYQVIQNGDSLKNAWAGGLNFTQFGTIDLDMDGIEDLVAFDRSGWRIIPFLKKNNNGTWKYIYAPQFIKKFPVIEDWMLLVDYNCDGKKDIFCSAPSGMGVYTNTSSASELSFQWALSTPYLTTDAGTGPVNLYVMRIDLPAIKDIDGDGDVDILTFGMNANTIDWHENHQNCGLDFVLKTECWGRFEENFYNNSVTLNACAGVKKTGHPSYSDQVNKGLHAGSTILALHLNNDNLMDMILGDVSFDDVTALFNGGTLDSAVIVSQDSLFPVYNVPVNVPTFPGMFYEDVTFDGVKDLLVAPNADFGAKSLNASWMYKNNGTSAVPVFSLTDTAFLQRDMIELGEGAYPVLFDLDVDGRTDILVSNFGKYIDSGVYVSSISFYKNIGTPTNPKFSLITTDLGNIKQFNIGKGLMPTFGDLDGDFDIDMILGAENGRLYYFQNQGSISNPSFVLTAPFYQGIDVGNFSAPVLFDVDEDGDLDLIIGEADGNLNYYNNNGSVPAAFSLVSDVFGGVDVSSYFNASGHSVPTFYMKNDTISLFVGSKDLGILQFDSVSQVMNQPAIISETLGTGNIISSNSHITPFGATRRNGRNQILYRASELNAEGFVYGTIRSIAFHIPGNPSNILTQGLSIRMKNLSLNEINNWESGLTEVYNQLHGFYSGWNEFNLSSKFVWDGTSDILVEICFSRNFPAQDIPVTCSNVGWNANAYGDVAVWNQVTQDGCEMPYLTSSTIRPNTTFNIIPSFVQTDVILKDGFNNAIAIAELNGDQYPEAILGNYSGGLIFFKGKEWVNNISVQEEKLSERLFGLELFPNPSKGDVTIILPEDFDVKRAEIEIYDITGRKVFHVTEQENHSIQLNLQKLNNGVYIVVANDGKQKRYTKLILN